MTSQETNQNQEMLNAIEVEPVVCSDIPMAPSNLVSLIQPSVLADGRKQAWQQLELLRQKGILKPDGTIFDLGCGYGRMAYPLRSYLNNKGRYIGYDVFGPFIDFLSSAFAVDKRFSFFHININNEQYNQGGQATFCGWPIADRSVDTTVAVSLFTHIDTVITAAYFNELKRIMKPDGMLFMQMYRTNNPELVTETAFRTVRLEQFWLNLFDQFGCEIVDQWSGDMALNMFHDAWNVILKMG